MRGSKPHKKDKTHNEISAAINIYNKIVSEKYKKLKSFSDYEKMRICMFDTHAIGNGFPDMIVSILGINILLEIKTGNGSLTEKEEKFINNWTGSVLIVNSVTNFFDQIKNKIEQEIIRCSSSFYSSDLTILFLDVKDVIDDTTTVLYRSNVD